MATPMKGSLLLRRISSEQSFSYSFVICRRAVRGAAIVVGVRDFIFGVSYVFNARHFIERTQRQEYDSWRNEGELNRIELNSFFHTFLARIEKWWKWWMPNKRAKESE